MNLREEAIAVRWEAIAMRLEVIAMRLNPSKALEDEPWISRKVGLEHIASLFSVRSTLLAVSM